MKKFFVLVVLVSVGFFFGCKQFSEKIDDYLKYWTNEACIDEVVCSSTHLVVDDYTYLSSEMDEAIIDFKLENKFGYKILMPTAENADLNIITFPDNANLELGVDYTISSPDMETIQLIYKKSVLERGEWGGLDLSPTFNLYSEEGRKFHTPYTFKCKVNTPPPKPTTIVLGRTESPCCFCVCVKVDDAEMMKKIGEEKLHKDLCQLQVSSLPSASFEVGESGFTNLGEALISSGEVSEIPDLTENGGPIPSGWVLFYKTDIEVNSQASGKTITISLKDQLGFVGEGVDITLPRVDLTVQDFYVSNSGHDTNNDGTKNKPFATLGKAVGKCTDAAILYTIYVMDNLSNTGACGTIDGDSAKGAITIEGLDSPVKQLNAAANGSDQRSVLTVKGKAQVTLKNLIITGGNNANGGGISVSGSETVLRLGEGVKVKGNEVTTNGGGVYVGDGAKLVLNAGSVIGGDATNPNKAKNGGGLYVEGINSTVEMNGATISCNEATENGGGLCFEYVKSLTMSSSTLKENQAGLHGGGLYVKGLATLHVEDSLFLKNRANTDPPTIGVKKGYGGGACFNAVDTGTIINTEIKENSAHEGGGFSLNVGGMLGDPAGSSISVSGGFISSNSVTHAGGGISLSHKDDFCTLKDVKVQGNKTLGGSGVSPYNNCGGGLYLWGGVLELKGNSEVSSNSATKNGSGAYLAYSDPVGAAVLKGGQLFIFDNARVSENNSVYLSENRTLYVGNQLTGTKPVATLTPNEYSEGRSVLEAAPGSSGSVTLADEVGKFAVTSDAGNTWSIDAAGKLKNGSTSTTTTEFWVSKSGNDGAVGNGATAPFKTLQHAIDKCTTAVIDYTIYIMDELPGGDSHGIIDNKSITIKGINSTTSVLDAQADFSDPRGVLTVKGGAKVTLENLSITGGCNTNGGGIFVSGSGTVLTLESGTHIKDNKASQKGGGVYVENGAKLVQNTGSIFSGNVVTSGGPNNGGGGVYVSGSGTIFEMNGGKIKSNTSPAGSPEGFGGGAYIDNNASLHITGGVLRGNSACYGGGVSLGAGTTFTMSGGSVDSNIANDGGGIWTKDGTLTMSGGTIESNQANEKGGGIFLYGDGPSKAYLTLSGATITGNKAGKSTFLCGDGGGVCAFKNVEFTMTSGTISKNRVEKGSSSTPGNGGGVAIHSSSLFAMSGGTVGGANSGDENFADGNGGGLYFDSSDALTITGGVISYNKASVHGGGIYMGNPTTSQGTLSITNSQITNNEATGADPNGYGGGICLVNVASARITNSDIAGNKAWEGAGISVGTGSDSQGTSLTITGGKIQKNEARCAGGGFSQSCLNSTTVLDGVTIGGTSGEGNRAEGSSTNPVYQRGGGIDVWNGAVTLKGTSLVQNNNAGKLGGGVHVGSFGNGTFIMEGGTIKDNVAVDKGSGLYLGNHSSGTFKMSGDARVDANNDVYLMANKQITIAGPLTGTTPVATITPEDYTAGTQVLTTTGSGVTLANEVSKFAVTPVSGSNWRIVPDGKIYNGVVIHGASPGAWFTLKNAVSNPSNKLIIVDGSITATSTDKGVIPVTHDVIITGKTDNSADVLDAIELNGIFNVGTGGSLTLINLTLQNGKVTDSNGGGGIYMAGEGLILSGCIVQNNHVVNATGNGGGICIESATNVLISNTQFKNNDADDNDDNGGKGGAIYIKGANPTIRSCTFVGNNSGSMGISFSGNIYKASLGGSTNGTFTLEGYTQTDGEICLEAGQSITLNSELKKADGGSIPNDFIKVHTTNAVFDGRLVLTGTGVGASYQKFKAVESSGGPGSMTIGSDGKLQ